MQFRRKIYSTFLIVHAFFTREAFANLCRVCAPHMFSLLVSDKVSIIVCLWRQILWLAYAITKLQTVTLLLAKRVALFLSLWNIKPANSILKTLSKLYYISRITNITETQLLYVKVPFTSKGVGASTLSSYVTLLYNGREAMKSNFLARASNCVARQESHDAWQSYIKLETWSALTFSLCLISKSLTFWSEVLANFAFLTIPCSKWTKIYPSFLLYLGTTIVLSIASIILYAFPFLTTAERVYFLNGTHC